MKAPILISFSVMLCGSSLFGIERPKSLDSDKRRVPAGQVDNGIKEGGAEGAAEMLPQEEHGKAAWLGVLTKPVSETLRIHLDVEEGVVLDYVAPDSPASKAGLRQHDILLAVEGKAVSSQQDLRAAIQGHRPGDKVNLQVIVQGGKGEREVEMAERPKGDRRCRVATHEAISLLDFRLETFPNCQVASAISFRVEAKTFSESWKVI